MQRYSLNHLRQFFRNLPRQGSVDVEPCWSALPELPVPSSIDEQFAEAPVAVVRLNNPDRRNALSCTMMHELDMAVDLLENKFQGSCVILSGVGTKAFCAGADLRSVETGLTSNEAGSMMSEYMHYILQRWQRLPQITLAALNGHAVGGGAELTTVCDHRIATEAATIRFVHPKMGISPGWGGGTRLTNLVGRSRALQLIAGAQQLTSTEALECGLLDAIATPDSAAPSNASASAATDGNGDSSNKAVEAALDFARIYLHDDCLNYGRDAVRGIKRVIHAADSDDDPHRGHSEKEFQDPSGATHRAMGHERAVFSSLWGHEAFNFALRRKLNDMKKRS